VDKEKQTLKKVWEKGEHYQVGSHLNAREYWRTKPLANIVRFIVTSDPPRIQRRPTTDWRNGWREYLPIGQEVAGSIPAQHKDLYT
jgi:hypothetical protein